jgi:hypothetical protein
MPPSSKKPWDSASHEAPLITLFNVEENLCYKILLNVVMKLI